MPTMALRVVRDTATQPYWDKRRRCGGSAGSREEPNTPNTSSTASSKLGFLDGRWRVGLIIVTSIANDIFFILRVMGMIAKGFNQEGGRAG